MFVSHRTLEGRRSRYPAARSPWVCDSGGFTELSSYGEWRTLASEYVDAVARYRDEIGSLEWCAPQDWMCEPWILEKTGKTVSEHQQLTIESVLRLRDAGLPVAPVLQGWQPDDYLAHVEMYAAAGVDLARERIVGVGSVCRRQDTRTAGVIFRQLASLGLRLHGFGVKVTGLAEYGWALESADSMSWSFNARRSPPLAGHAHKACNNCMEWALRWRGHLLARPVQEPLWKPTLPGKLFQAES